MLQLADPLLLATAFGAIVGLVLALSGAGGGIIAVPLLVFGLDLPIRQAGPIGLLAVALAAGLGAILGLLRGTLRYRAAGLIGLFGMALAPAGVWLAQRIPNRPLLLAFAVVLIGTAWRMLRHPHARPAKSSLPAATRPCRLDPSDGRLDWTLPCARALAATGLISGLLSGLLGVGGGFVIVPALTRHSDLSPESVQVTSLGVIALVAFGGLAAAAASGSIAWGIGMPFAAGAISGLLLGRGIAARLAGQRLQQGFALLCLIVAALLVIRAVAPSGAF